MSDNYILNGWGEPVPCSDLIEWAEWMEKADRKIARNVIGDARISTVFLGLDHKVW